MLFAVIFLPVILISGFPIAFFGLSLHNWRFALLYSVSVSLIFIAATVIVKWAVILSSPSLADMSVFSIGEVKIGEGATAGIDSIWFWIARAAVSCRSRSAS